MPHPAQCRPRRMPPFPPPLMAKGTMQNAEYMWNAQNTRNGTVFLQNKTITQTLRLIPWHNANVIHICRASCRSALLESRSDRAYNRNTVVYKLLYNIMYSQQLAMMFEKIRNLLLISSNNAIIHSSFWVSKLQNWTLRKKLWTLQKRISRQSTIVFLWNIHM